MLESSYHMKGSIIGKTDYSSFPVAVVMFYMAIKGTSDGPFFKLTNGQPLTKLYFTHTHTHTHSVSMRT